MTVPPNYLLLQASEDRTLYGCTTVVHINGYVSCTCSYDRGDVIIDNIGVVPGGSRIRTWINEIIVKVLVPEQASPVVVTSGSGNLVWCYRRPF